MNQQLQHNPTVGEKTKTYFIRGNVLHTGESQGCLCNGPSLNTSNCAFKHFLRQHLLFGAGAPVNLIRAGCHRPLNRHWGWIPPSGDWLLQYCFLIHNSVIRVVSPHPRSGVRLPFTPQGSPHAVWPGVCPLLASVLSAIIGYMLVVRTVLRHAANKGTI